MRVEARQNEAIRGAATTRSSVGMVCSIPSSLIPSLSLSLPLPHPHPSLSLPLIEPLRSSLPVIYGLFLSLSPFLSPRRGSRLKTRSKSRRRVASSRFRDSKEGSFLFPTLYRRHCLCRDARVLRLYFASSHDDVAGASVIRRETPGPISRTLALFWTRRTFWVAHVRVVLFQRRTYLVSSFLSFSADLSGDRPPCYILALRLTKS